MAANSDLKVFDTIRPKPVVVGTGLIALDVIYGTDPRAEPALAAGGTCGNVLTALSYLGWRAYPIARLAGDGTGDWVREDLAAWGVQLDFAALPSTSGTPVVVQRIHRQPDGRIVHRFSLSCRDCGRWLPTYQAVTGSMMLDTIEKLPHVDVCFIDRASRGAVLLAEWARANGALVYSEPSGKSTAEQLARLINSSHILKYSSEHAELVDRAKQLVPTENRSAVWLEIETLGSDGLRYRARDTRAWRNVKAFSLSRVVDTAGAGDWCTAGIIHMLGQGGAEAFEHAPVDIVDSALTFGQAMSAWTCGFEGARGGMYSATKPEFRASVSGILGGSVPRLIERSPAASADNQHLALCRECTVGATA